VTSIRHRTLSVNGLDMHVADAGDGPPVLHLHGFPELWSSWRHQLTALGESGFHAIAPDQRGYGGTTAPPSVDDYDIHHHLANVVALLDALGGDGAVVVGHDWGSLVLSTLVHLAADRVRAAVWMSVPYFPRTPIPPTQLFKAAAGENFMYILYFQRVGPADDELSRDPRRTMSRLLWSASGDAPDAARRPLPKEGTGFLDGMDDPTALPSWLTEDDLDYFTDEFQRTGFTGGLNWYRNLDRNWETTEHLSGAGGLEAEPTRPAPPQAGRVAEPAVERRAPNQRVVSQPALFVAGDRDPVIANRALVDNMDALVPDLRGKVLIEGAGHWTQQERPEQVNAALLGFLRELD